MLDSIFNYNGSQQNNMFAERVEKLYSSDDVEREKALDFLSQKIRTSNTNGVYSDLESCGYSWGKTEYVEPGILAGFTSLPASEEKIKMEGEKCLELLERDNHDVQYAAAASLEGILHDLRNITDEGSSGYLVEKMVFQLNRIKDPDVEKKIIEVFGEHVSRTSRYSKIRDGLNQFLMYLPKLDTVNQSYLDEIFEGYRMMDVFPEDGYRTTVELFEQYALENIEVLPQVIATRVNRVASDMIHVSDNEERYMEKGYSQIERFSHKGSTDQLASCLSMMGSGNMELDDIQGFYNDRDAENIFRLMKHRYSKVRVNALYCVGSGLAEKYPELVVKYSDVIPLFLSNPESPPQIYALGLVKIVAKESPGDLPPLDIHMKEVDEGVKNHQLYTDAKREYDKARAVDAL